MESFPNEYGALADKKSLKQSKLMKLNLKVDDAGVLRCDGRLKYSENLPYDVRYPINIGTQKLGNKIDLETLP